MFPFIILLLIELWGLIAVGGALGTFGALLWVLLSLLWGVAMIRSAGFVALRSLANQSTPDDDMFSILNGALVLIGGFALVIPGLLTDLFGLACLFEPSRAKIARFILDHAGVYSFVNKYSSKATFGQRAFGEQNERKSSKTIDATWREDDKR